MWHMSPDKEVGLCRSQFWRCKNLSEPTLTLQRWGPSGEPGSPVCAGAGRYSHLKQRELPQPSWLRPPKMLRPFKFSHLTAVNSYYHCLNSRRTFRETQTTSHSSTSKGLGFPWSLEASLQNFLELFIILAFIFQIHNPPRVNFCVL